MEVPIVLHCALCRHEPPLDGHVGVCVSRRSPLVRWANCFELREPTLLEEVEVAFVPVENFIRPSHAQDFEGRHEGREDPARACDQMKVVGGSSHDSAAPSWTNEQKHSEREATFFYE